MDSKTVRYYETVKGEAARLSQGSHRLEFERTKEFLLRYLPSPPAQILDVGGGPGAHAFWLAERMCRVHLMDNVPLHVEQVKAEDSYEILAGISSGDARNLNFESAPMNALVSLDSFYHLPERSDRFPQCRY
ncbi:MAG: class I SAM-dependent methyltransferase [Candidatus Poribacteria bacterium]|nr:class I SAM-dependent methyltransferase [Candidatus Poribacteria bacterium]